MKKQFMAAGMAALMAMSMAACGGSSSSTSTTAAASSAVAKTEAAKDASSEASSEAGSEAASADFKTVEPGVLHVGTSPDFAPYEFIDKDGNVVGFDISLAKEIADTYGLKLQIDKMSFDGILMDVQSGNVDLGISGFSPTDERKEVVDFSDIYYSSSQSFMIRTEDKDKFKSFDDINKKDYSIGAQLGSIQQELCQQDTPDANGVFEQDVTTVISDLANDKLDGAFIETATAEQYAKDNPDIMIAWAVPYDADGSAVAIKKGNTALTEAVNKVIAKVTSDGTMDKFVADAQKIADESGANGGEDTSADTTAAAQ